MVRSEFQEIGSRWRLFAVFVNFAQLLTPPLLTLCRVSRISSGDVKMTDLSILLGVDLLMLPVARRS